MSEVGHWMIIFGATVTVGALGRPVTPLVLA